MLRLLDAVEVMCDRAGAPQGTGSLADTESHPDRSDGRGVLLPHNPVPLYPPLLKPFVLLQPGIDGVRDLCEIPLNHRALLHSDRSEEPVERRHLHLLRGSGLLEQGPTNVCRIDADLLSDSLDVVRTEGVRAEVIVELQLDGAPEHPLD